MSKSAAQPGFGQVPCLVKVLVRPELAINDSGKSPLAIGRTSTADLHDEFACASELSINDLPQLNCRDTQHRVYIVLLVLLVPVRAVVLLCWILGDKLLRDQTSRLMWAMSVYAMGIESAAVCNAVVFVEDAVRDDVVMAL